MATIVMCCLTMAELVDRKWKACGLMIDSRDGKTAFINSCCGDETLEEYPLRFCPWCATPIVVLQNDPAGS